ncbi:MAG: ribosome assembly RNA-binding protein YhbY [Arenimonas sp.]|nr:ribosome assembly RNA-binding protein YhbY [Arenimonas sp.]
MAAALSNPQKRYLRGLAHDLKPVILVGAKGITDNLVAETGLAIERHELIKVRVAAGDRELRDLWIGELCERAQSALVARIGNIAVLYRRSQENPLIVLPKA